MLEAKESLFLVKTFPRLASGQIALETETSDSEDYFFDVVDLVADEDELFVDFFQYLQNRQCQSVIYNFIGFKQTAKKNLISPITT